ncbi:MAG: twin transmembrane helix small protein [Alphaproteobacteria bacterium]|nr:twin transmembrane helix small protein [Alphaproteobacteria bacterium]NDC56657.1 twin transmembrane helix small protein [Alphaproteobacteria bacterium]
MAHLSVVLIVAALLLVFASLALGLFSMVKGGEFNKKYGNRLMRARLGLQAVALVVFMAALAFKN